MKVGDVMVCREGPFSTAAGALRSGCGHYTHAILVSVAPFVMVSEEGDMLWECQDPVNYVALCEASPAARKEAMARFRQEQNKKG